MVKFVWKLLAWSITKNFHELSLFNIAHKILQSLLSKRLEPNDHKRLFVMIVVSNVANLGHQKFTIQQSWKREVRNWTKHNICSWIWKQPLMSQNGATSMPLCLILVSYTFVWIDADHHKKLCPNGRDLSELFDTKRVIGQNLYQVTFSIHARANNTSCRAKSSHFLCFFLVTVGSHNYDVLDNFVYIVLQPEITLTARSAKNSTAECLLPTGDFLNWVGNSKENSFLDERD